MCNTALRVENSQRTCTGKTAITRRRSAALVLLQGYKAWEGYEALRTELWALKLNDKRELLLISTSPPCWQWSSANTPLSGGRLWRCGPSVEQQPVLLKCGTRVTAVLGQGITAHRPSAIRGFLRTPRLNSLLLFSFLQEKKWNRNFKPMKFHTGNEIETTDTAEQNRLQGFSAEDMLKEEVAKSLNRLPESTNKTGQWTVDFHTHTTKVKLCRHYGIYLPSRSWCQVLACTAGHWHLLFNPRSALAQSPAAASSSELPWLARVTHRAPGGHFGRSTAKSYRPLNGHYLTKITTFSSPPICFECLSWK